MVLVSFLLILACFLACLLFWSFRNLPKDGWQIVAAIPVQKLESGTWKGIVLTYYGVFISVAVAIALLLFFIMMGSIKISAFQSGLLCLIIISVFVPASRLLARIVEKKQHTLTVGGASFVAILIIPILITVFKYLDPYYPLHLDFPLMPTLAALSVSYTIGEGLGRLACISFGCCYGPEISSCGPSIRKIFKRCHFIFSGLTKKITYASGSDQVPVVPIQGITSSLYVVTGVVGLSLWFAGLQNLALLLSIVVTQGWRFISEFFRSDFRGLGRISTYQVMALVSIAYTLIIVTVPSFEPAPDIDIADGLYNCLSPIVILTIQFLATGVFLFTGVSSVIGSNMSFFIYKDKI